MSDMLAEVAARWRVLDPLLPAPILPADVAALAVPGAVGAPRHLCPELGEPLPLWFAARRFTLRPLVAGPDVAGGLDRLLTGWRALLQADPDAADEDSAAYVTVPSRDTEAVPVLVRHGLTPYVVVAARAVARPVTGVTGVTGLTGVAVRRAGAEDLDVLTDLTLAQFRSETDFGTAVDRSDAATRLRTELTELLDAPDPWVWLAEAGGRVIGALTANPPDANGWLGQFTGACRIAYLRMARVEPAARGAGAGAALTAAAHRAFDRAGVDAALLHYSLLNPRSGPFWHRMGYRPLWTNWKLTPAASLR